MISTVAPTRVFLSPALADGVQSGLDVQRALSHLIDHLFRLTPGTKHPYSNTMSSILGITDEYVSAIDTRTLRTHPDLPEKQRLNNKLRHRQFITSSDIHQSAAALREIADHAGVCKALSQKEEVRRALFEYSRDSLIDISGIQAEAEKWLSELPTQTSPHTFNHGLWRSVVQSLKLAKANPTLNTPFELAHLLLSNDPKVAEEILARGGIEAFQDHPHVKRFLNHVSQGPISTRDFDDYFGGLPPREPAHRDTMTDADAFFEAFRDSCGAGGKPYYSHWALTTLIADFMHIAALAASSTLNTPSRHDYKKLLGVGSLSLLQHQNWRPIFLNLNLMEEIQQLIAKGSKIIAISNHLSHLDPILLFGVHPGAFASKKELETSPVLGKNPFLHPANRDLWSADSTISTFPHFYLDREGGKAAYLELEKTASQWVDNSGDQSATVWVMPEGKRQETRDRDESVGALRFRSGAFNFAAHTNEKYSNDTYVVVYAICGTGQILPTNIKQVLRQGVKQNQTVMIAPCGILKVSDYQGNTAAETARNLEIAAIRMQAMTLGKIQAANNNTRFY